MCSPSMPVVTLSKLVECYVVKRLTRFTVLAEIRGERMIVYMNNTGRLEGYLRPGKRGYCTENFRGKHKYRIVGVEDGEYVTLIDTNLQEKTFLALQERGLISWLSTCKLHSRNYKLENAVVDFAFKCDDGIVLIELKSAVMRLKESLAGYPDAPTQRGRRQFIELARYASMGGRAIVVFMVAVPGATMFKLHCGEDELIKHAVEVAILSGVEFKALNVFLDPRRKAVVLGSTDLPVDLSCKDVST